MQLNLELTLEQQFDLKVYENAAQQMDAAMMRSLLIDAIRQGMVKDNVIRQFMKVGTQL